MTIRDCWNWLFCGGDFVPLRECGWGDLGDVNTTADICISAAGLAVPVVIFFILFNKKNFPNRPVFILAAVVAAFVGLTHLCQYLVFDHAWYRMVVVAKVATAVLSLIFCFTLVCNIPGVMRMKMPEDYRLEIAERKRRERETLKEASLNRSETITLELKITERTDELAQANTALRDAERRKTEYMAMLAHELRNPLAPITTGLHLMKKGITDRAKDAARDMIERQVKHLARLIDDLLDAQRLVRGKIQLRRHPCVLQDIIKQTQDTFVPFTQNRKVDVVIDVPAVPIWLHADADRIEQVFNNVLLNSHKFEADEILVAVESDGRTAVVRVKDDGMGICKEILPRVCDPFVQGRQTYDRPFGGLGVGLTLAKYIVESHGGQIRVESPGEGMGTEVTVSFPVAPTDAETSVPMIFAAGATRTDRRVVIVDDNEDAAKSLAMYLKMYGYDVVGTYLTGPALIADLPALNPDVVLMDLALPGMDGYEAARHVRNKFPNTKIIAVTGYGRPEDIDRSRASGINTHLVKPVDVDALREIIDNS